MPTPTTLYGSTRLVPGPTEGENGWAAEGTAILLQLCQGLEGSTMKVGTVIWPYLASTETTLLGGATLSPTHPLHKVTGSGGPVTIAGIAAGSQDGQLLTIVGNHAVNSVTVVNGGGVTLSSGSVTLGLGEYLDLCWDATAATWYERRRSESGTFTYPGGVELYELPANGSSKFTIRAPAALAADLIFTLPSAVAAPGYLYSDINGNLSISAGSADLDSAYDSGRTITVDAGSVTLNGTAGANPVLAITQSQAATCLTATQNGDEAGILVDQNTGTQPALKTTGGSAGLETDAPVLLANNVAISLKKVAGTPVDSLKRTNTDTLLLGNAAENLPIDITTGASFVRIVTGGGERVRVLDDGNVGIGATAPAELLEVRGSDPVVVIREPAEDVLNKAELQFLTGTGAGADSNTIGVITSSIVQIAPTLKSSLSFRTNVGDSVEIAMHITEDSRVGIGTTTPVSQLNVVNNQDCVTGRFQQVSYAQPVLWAYQTQDSYALVATKDVLAGDTFAVFLIENSTAADSIYDDSGAKLTAGGVWTDAPCKRELKADIVPVVTDEAFLGKLSKLSFSRYATKRMKERGKDDSRYGLFLDELVEHFGFKGDGVAPGEIAALAVGGVKALAAQVAALEARIKELEKA